jgi:hypothetical protein
VLRIEFVGIIFHWESENELVATDFLSSVWLDAKQHTRTHTHPSSLNIQQGGMVFKSCDVGGQHCTGTNFCNSLALLNGQQQKKRTQCEHKLEGTTT